MDGTMDSMRRSHRGAQPTRAGHFGNNTCLAAGAASPGPCARYHATHACCAHVCCAALCTALTWLPQNDFRRVKIGGSSHHLEGELLAEVAPIDAWLDKWEAYVRQVREGSQWICAHVWVHT